MKSTQKDLDDTKLLNENLGKQLEYADHEYNETVDKLQKELEDRDNLMVEKNKQTDKLQKELKERENKMVERNRHMEEFTLRANLKADNLSAQVKQAEKLMKASEGEYNKLR